MPDHIKQIQRRLQSDKINTFRRRLPFGELITERSENAAEYGFGEGTTCYDSAVILGDVRVGKNVWIGPNTILDGSGGPLVIGDFCSISAGVQIYTHNTVDWCLSGGAADYAKAPTSIGNRVFIGPNAVIAMGVVIGDGVVVGAMSFVDKSLPSGVRAWGCPARIQNVQDDV